MTYTADNSRQPRDVPFKPAGIGMGIGGQCIGCGQRRNTTLGSKGRGVQKRCSHCVAAKQARAA